MIGRKVFICEAVLGIVLALLFIACSNSEYTSSPSRGSIVDDGTEAEDNATNSFQGNDDGFIVNLQKYIPLNDIDFPYAGLPRIVIETRNRQRIKDVVNEIPAKLQFWGADKPESEIMDLTIRGRGNSSWTSPKKSYKIEFKEKQSILGMPANRDWALISNYADKTLMKNYLMYQLSANLGAYYAPKCRYVEFFLNDEYLGIYLLTETIKIGKHRVNIPQTSESYIVEFDAKIRDGEQMVVSDVLEKDGKIFRIHDPQNASTQELFEIEDYIRSFETFLLEVKDDADNSVGQWIDVEEYIKHYWVQEFSKNPDAWFLASVFFSWVKGGVIRMGPVWDFDLSFGGHSNELPYKEYSTIHRLIPEEWYIKFFYWNKYLFKDSVIQMMTKKIWLDNRDAFGNVIDSIDSIYGLLESASNNNFKRWNILGSTEYMFHSKAFTTYNDAVDDLKKWIRKRLAWIDKAIELY